MSTKMTPLMEDTPDVERSTDNTLAAELATDENSSYGSWSKERPLKYSIDKRPPVPIIVFAAFQHILMAIGGLLVTPLVIADGVCAKNDDPVRITLTSSTMVMSGISTIMQTLIGVRLPILQGPAAGFLVVLLAVKETDEWKCINPKTVNGTLLNASEAEDGVLSQTERLRQLSGTVMVGSLVEIIIGGTGLVGLLLRFVGPITVAPVIALLGLAFCKLPIYYSEPSWELSLVGAVLMVVFSLYLRHIKVPCPTRDTCKRGERKNGLRVFQVLPVLFSVMVVWALSAILTVTDVFPNDPDHPRFRARADTKAGLLAQTPWFYFPYPGQFGMPSFSVAIFIGLIAVYIASIIESVGDYFAAARACQVSAPPNHAVNRGIMVEGIGALLSGAVGTGHATTSYTHNIAVMALTRTANRYVMVCAGIIIIILGLVGKFSAVLANIPDPVIGGIAPVLVGMLVAMGLSTLQHVNMSLARNQLIVGTALFCGVFIPQWVDTSPDFFKTGSKEADNILVVVLGTPMFVGGLIAVVLDNTARGSREDRGIDAWRKNTVDSNTIDGKTKESDTYNSTYGWFCLNGMYRAVPWCSKLPFMPPYKRQDSQKLPSD